MLRLDNESCQLCERCLGKGNEKRSAVINGSGDENPRLLLVCDAPNKRDNDLKRFGSGDIGTILRELLRQAELSDVGVFVTGATRCYTGSAPVKKELLKCRPFLKAEIEEIRPEMIITLGAGSLSSILPGKTVHQARGSVYWSEEFGCNVVPTYAPGIIYRDPGKREVLLADFRKAKTAMEGHSEPVSTEAIVARSVQEAQEIAEILLSAEEFSFDFETTGLNYLARDAQVLCASFSDRVGVGYVVPLIGQYRSSIWTPGDYRKVVEILTQILESDVPKIASNGKFDCLWAFHVLGITVQAFDFDCQLAYAMLHEERPHNLEHMRTLFTQMAYYEEFKGEYKDRTLMAQMGYAVFPNEVLWQYAAADADCEFRIAQKLRPLIAAEAHGAGGVFHARRAKIEAA